jgi:hypothetical protein
VQIMKTREEKIRKIQNKKGEKGRERIEMEMETMEGLHDTEKIRHGTVARTLR